MLLRYLRLVVVPLLLAVAVVPFAMHLDGLVPPEVNNHLDAAPPGVDVHHKPSVEELRNEVELNLFPGRPASKTARTLGDGDAPTAVAAGSAPAGTPAGAPGLPGLSAHVAPSCSGTGSDGNRVQVVYAVEQGKTDRYSSLLPMLRSWVADVDDTFALSSQKTGAGLRVRWVHQNCVPVIAREVLPAGALKNGFTATMNALKARGYTSKARKYLVFADDATLCGIGQMYNDSDKLNNYNDGAVPMFARVDSPCWTFPQNWHSTAAHEIMHTLGGVQDNAAHSTGGGHCTDESDAMCYDDDGAGRVTVQQACSGSEGLFDCRNDDYFHTAPAAGSYLAAHWNPATSSFLDRTAKLPAAPTVTISGPSSVRPGLAATLTATSGTALSYRWSATPATCLPGGKTAASVKLMCPSYYTGSVQVSVAGAGSTGVAGTASTRVTLTTGPAATMTVRLAAGPGRVYHGKSTRLTGTLRYGTAAVRGSLYLYAAPAGGGSFTRIAGPRDTGADGAYTWTVAPKKSTRYAVTVGNASGTGWRTPAHGSATVKVSPHPTRWSASAKTGRPSVVRGKLTRTDGKALVRQKVYLQYRYAGSSTWRTLGSRTTTSYGNATFKVQPKRYTYYRWVYKGSAANARSGSASRFVRR